MNATQLSLAVSVSAAATLGVFSGFLMQSENMTTTNRVLAGGAGLGMAGGAAFLSNRLSHAGAGVGLLMGTAVAGIALGTLMGTAHLRQN